MESVNVLSSTCQEFRGTRYYLCGRYFQRKGKRLHIAVWEANFGSVPPGFHVHHIDEDRSHNQPTNLQAIPKGKHLALHMTPERRALSKEFMRRANVASRAWHGSPEGKAWHAANGRAQWARRPAVPAVCRECGRSYETYFPTRAKHCSNACRQKATRERRKTR